MKFEWRVEEFPCKLSKDFELSFSVPELILSIRDDYRFKLVYKGEEDLFFF